MRNSFSIFFQIKANSEIRLNLEKESDWNQVIWILQKNEAILTSIIPIGLSMDCHNKV